MNMGTVRRLAQLTTLVIVFFLVSGAAFFLIESWSGGRLERWRKAPFTSNIGDESLAVELATLPIVLAVFACWLVVRIFRLRSVHNEIEDTFHPILTVLAGYGRFVLIIVAALYLLLGHGWAAAAHLVIAIVMFAVFYRSHRMKERAMEEQIEREEAEDDDD